MMHLFRRVVRLIPLLLFCLPAEAAEHSLEKIREALTEEYTSLRSLYVKYSYLNEVITPQNTTTLHSQNEYWLDGNKSATLSETLWANENETRTWGTHTFDGQWTQIGLLTALNPPKVEFLQRYRGEHPNELGMPDVLLAIGFMFMNEPGHLATILEDADAKLIGPEAVDKHPCVRVESGKSYNRAGGGVCQYTAWLDPAMHWLPRRFVCRFHPDSRNYEQMTENGRRAVLRDYRIAEFGWYPDPILGRDRPFPTKITAVNWLGNYVFEVQSLQVNSPVDKERFVVEPTFGTKILEGEYRDDPRARRWLHGGIAAEVEDRRQKVELARKLAERTKQETARVLAMPENPVVAVDATPRRDFRALWWIVGGCSLLILGLAMIFLKRH